MESSSDRGTVGIRAHPAPGKSYFDRNRLFDLTHSSLRFAKDHITLLLMAATLLAAALNGFFIAYRTAIFKVLSYDDYAPYLLYVLGEPGGEIPHSPWVYRIGSIILAAPFYNLPLVSLNGGGAREIIASDTLFYLKATQAICFANLFYVSVSCLLIFAVL